MKRDICGILREEAEKLGLNEGKYAGIYERKQEKDALTEAGKRDWVGNTQDFTG